MLASIPFSLSSKVRSDVMEFICLVEDTIALPFPEGNEVPLEFLEWVEGIIDTFWLTREFPIDGRSYHHCETRDQWFAPLWNRWVTRFLSVDSTDPGASPFITLEEDKTTQWHY